MNKANSIETERLKIVLLTVILNVVSVFILSKFSWSDWKTGAVLNLIDNLLIVGYTILRRDRFMAHLIVFGLVVGWSELMADAWLVDVTKTLDYSIGGGPMVWRSPLWMPFAWEIVTVQFGYLGLRLYESFRFWGLAAVGLLGAVNIPYYEEMARLTNWWVYGNCGMFLHTPYYIILGEFFIAVVLAALTISLKVQRWPRTVLMGLLGGIGIWGSYILGYVVFEIFPLYQCLWRGAAF